MMNAPYEHSLNLAMQSVLTFGSWGLTALILTIALRKDLRERSPFYTLLVLAALVGAFAEPLYDVGFMLLFYVPGQWTTFSAFDIPQPVWTHSGYVVLYAGPAMFICEQIRRDLTPNGLYKWAGVALLLSMAFEIIGINGGTYAYWGPHVLRIFNYPLAIGVLEAAQVICYSVAAAQLRSHATNRWALLGLFALFPCTFYLANFGAGSPLIIALHLDQPASVWVTLGTLASIGFALLLVRSAGYALPNRNTRATATTAQGLSAVHA